MEKQMAEEKFTIKPLSPIGAEISGLSGNGIDPQTQAAIYSAWLRHGILLFKNVASSEQHVALSRCFGELMVHPLPELRLKDNPFLFPLGGDENKVAFVFDETDVRVNRIPWHRDTAYQPNICKGAMLRMLDVPPEEGETLFADNAAAYDELPDDVKARLEGLEFRAILKMGVYDHSGVGTWWKTARLARGDEYPAGVAPPKSYKTPDRSKFPPVALPAVIVHPESGRKCLFLSPMNIECFVGMEAAESKDLIEYLVEHMTSARFVYRHRWDVNDAIIWDNRRVLHAAIGNRPEYSRQGQRTTLADQMSIGRYIDAGA
jgi:taurine dioxygenase